MGSQRVRHDWATELNWTVTLTLFISDIITRSLFSLISISCSSTHQPSNHCCSYRKPDPGADPVQWLSVWTSRLCSLRGEPPLLLRWGPTGQQSFLMPPVNAPLSHFSTLRQQTAPPGGRGRSLRRESGDPWPGLLGHHLWWRLGPGRCPRGVQAAGLWRSPQCHEVCLLRGGIRAHLAGRPELHRKWVPRVEVPFPGLGSAHLQTQGGRGGHLLRSVLHTVHRLGEGRTWSRGERESESWGRYTERIRERGFLAWSLSFQQTWRLGVFTSSCSSWRSSPFFSAQFPGKAIS